MSGIKRLLSVWCLIVCLLVSASACADTIFEDRFDTLDRWELADKGGGSSMSIEPDHSVPEPYGPTVLSLRGEYTMALAHDLVVGDCTITALWRDVEPDDYDADGVLAARAMQPRELKGTPLADVGEGLYWVEQDSDEGFQIKVRDAKAREQTLASFGERSLTNDRTWNKTGWIWQKWQLDGSTMRARFCPIHADNEMFSKGRVGLRVWSGHAHVAYFCVSAHDERTEPIRYYLGLDRTAAFDDGTITVTLYTQLERDIADASVSFGLDDSDARCVKRLATPKPPMKQRSSGTSPVFRRTGRTSSRSVVPRVQAPIACMFSSKMTAPTRPSIPPFAKCVSSIEKEYRFASHGYDNGHER